MYGFILRNEKIFLKKFDCAYQIDMMAFSFCLSQDLGSVLLYLTFLY